MIGGVFATAAAAYDAKFAAAACFWRYYVVPTDHLPDLAPGQYVLIAFTWDRAIADAESLACNLSGDGFVATLTEFNPPLRSIAPRVSAARWPALATRGTVLPRRGPTTRTLERSRRAGTMHLV